MKNDISKINIAGKLSMINEHWTPRVAADINDHRVKLAKVKGEFVPHTHDKDEMFLVIKGSLIIRITGGDDILLNEGEMIVVPRGVEHCPVAEEETEILLFEHASTINTGNMIDKRTVGNPQRI